MTRFHDVHGAHVTLSDAGTVAVADYDDDREIFSQNPLKPEQAFTVQVVTSQLETFVRALSTWQNSLFYQIYSKRNSNISSLALVNDMNVTHTL